MSAADPGLSLEPREAAYEWIREVADMMGLKDWTIIVARDPAEYAEVRFRGPYLECKIALSNHLLLEPDNEIRDTLIHELFHIPHGDYHVRIAGLSDVGGMSDPMQKLLMEEVERTVEVIVDFAARRFVDHAQGLPSLDKLRAATVARTDDDRARGRRSECLTPSSTSTSPTALRR